MKRGQAIPAKYGDKGGVYVAKGTRGNVYDLYLDAVCISFSNKETITVVFLEGLGTIDRGHIRVIDAKDWHGPSYLRSGM